MVVKKGVIATSDELQRVKRAEALIVCLFLLLGFVILYLVIHG